MGYTVPVTAFPSTSDWANTYAGTLVEDVDWFLTFLGSTTYSGGATSDDPHGISVSFDGSVITIVSPHDSATFSVIVRSGNLGYAGSTADPDLSLELTNAVINGSQYDCTLEATASKSIFDGAIAALTFTYAWTIGAQSYTTQVVETTRGLGTYAVTCRVTDQYGRYREIVVDRELSLAQLGEPVAVISFSQDPSPDFDNYTFNGSTSIDSLYRVKLHETSSGAVMGSFDFPGNITYAWTIVDARGVTVVTHSTVGPWTRRLQVGVNVVTLIVTDRHGATDTATISPAINPQPAPTCTDVAGSLWSAVQEGTGTRVRFYPEGLSSEIERGLISLFVAVDMWADLSGKLYFLGTREDNSYQVRWSTDGGRTFGGTIMTAWDNTYFNAQACGLSNGGMATVAMKYGTSPVEVYARYTTDYTTYSTPVLVDTMSTEYRVLSIFQKWMNGSARLIATDGVEFEKYSTDVGRTWHDLP